MPVISRFYGVVIKMYFSQSEHGVPHFHAEYAEFVAVYKVQPLGLLEGSLPNRAHNLVMEWAQLHQNELLNMWNSNNFHQLPGLE